MGRFSKRDTDNNYSRPENVNKRREFYNAKKSLKECGVIFPEDKPWYCGEVENCCHICSKCYKKNFMRV